MNPDQTQQNNDHPTVPSDWPGAYKLYAYSKSAVKNNVGLLFVLWFIYTILSYGPRGYSDVAKDTTAVMSLALFVALLVSIYITVAINYAALKSVAGEKVSFGTALRATAAFYIPSLIATFLTSILVTIGFLLLIVPGLILSARTSLTLYYIIDQDMGPIQAIKASLAETKGHALKIWGIFGMFLLCALPVLTIIGIPFALYLLLMYSAALPIMYRYIQQTSSVSSAPAPVSPIQ